MVRCQRCGLDCVVAGKCGQPSSGVGDDGHADRVDTRNGGLCPVCRLEGRHADDHPPDELVRRAQMTLGFESASTVRSRLLDTVERAMDTEVTRTGVSTLRVENLRRLGVALGLPASLADELTARELRAHIADEVDVDDSPASAFRKDALVDVTVYVADTVSPSTGQSESDDDSTRERSHEVGLSR